MAEICGSGGYKADSAPEPEDLLAFQRSLDDALASALTKFDSMGAYFKQGMPVQAVAAMLQEEIMQDKDFLHCTATPSQEAQLRKFVMQMVGKSYGLWKKGNPGAVDVNSGENGRGADVGLGWASIDNYPGWVYEQIQAYLTAEPGEKAMMKRQLEATLLEEPLCSATVKYDGTCFGKLDTGALSGRRHLVGKACETYINTSTAACSKCDIGVVRSKLSSILGVELAEGSVCVWGELMCNPGYYGYLARGLAEKWVCFGAVVQLPATQDDEALVAWSKKLAQHGFAHSVSSQLKIRLFLCPTLRELLVQAGCQAADNVAETTHADLVSSNAQSLINGHNEGIVLVFRRACGQASIRKWKNSAEGQDVSKKHAKQLRSLDARNLAREGLLHARIADMVETMIQVAEATTVVPKMGRKQLAKAP